MSVRPWLIVSKPLVPPFRDGSTVLVRDLVRGLDPRFALRHFGDPERPLRSSARVLPARAMGYAPGLRAKARVLATLLDPRHRDAGLHFVFSPNPLSSRVLALLRRLPPRRPVVQTLAASAGAERWVRLLRPLDAVVVHSEDARARLVTAGLDRARVHCIHPGVAPVALQAEPLAQRRLLYAGDLGPAVVERLAALARGLERSPGLAWQLCVAARPKAQEDARWRARLAEALRPLGPRAQLLGEVEDMDALLRRSSLQLFLADHLRRKVDLPLVLLEGMARGVPALTTDLPPLRELFAAGAARGLEPGRALPAAELVPALLELLEDGERLIRWSRDAHALVRADFSLERMVQQYEALYDACGSLA